RGFQEPKTASMDLGVRALEHSLGRDVSNLWKVLSKQYGRVSVRVDDHKFIAFYYEGRNEDPTFVGEVIDQWGPIARKHKLRTKPQHKGSDFVSFGLPRRSFDEGVRIVANDTDSGAGSDEDKFYQDPEKREVLEFARSQAISNIKDVAIDHASELDIPLKQELKDVAEAPPLPTEIVEEPGGAAVSTLNRYVIKTDDPAVAPAVAMNKDRMAFWKAELEGFPKSADRLRNLMRELDALEELDENLNGVIDAFDASMKTAAKINPEVSSQFEVLNKARKGIQSAEAIQKNIQAIIETYPEDKTAKRALKDASTMIARFKRTESKAAGVVRRISKKEAPPALRKA
ncbi:MAG: hypothetical protein VX969_01460, partial [Verrucomicrobiota bacterium]|nr:hypothetical protein [Verrucomicrobiota bacterium]